jgi:hypothetical protein
MMKSPRARRIGNQQNHHTEATMSGGTARLLSIGRRQKAERHILIVVRVPDVDSTTAEAPNGRHCAFGVLGRETQTSGWRARLVAEHRLERLLHRGRASAQALFDVRSDFRSHELGAQQSPEETSGAIGITDAQSDAREATAEV